MAIKHANERKEILFSILKYLGGSVRCHIFHSASWQKYILPDLCKVPLVHLVTVENTHQYLLCHMASICLFSSDSVLYSMAVYSPEHLKKFWSRADFFKFTFTQGAEYGNLGKWDSFSSFSLIPLVLSPLLSILTHWKFQIFLFMMAKS